MGEPAFDMTVDEDIDRYENGPSRTRWRVEITNMNKWYGEFHVLRDINLTVNAAASGS